MGMPVTQAATKDDEWDAPPDGVSLMSAIDRTILTMTEEAKLSPAQRVVMEGMTHELDSHRLLATEQAGLQLVKSQIDAEQERRESEQERLAEARQGIEVRRSITRRAPLEFMRYQSKAKLEEWEYLAGVRFRMDWTIARTPSAGVMNIASMELFATDAARSQAVGYTGKRGSSGGGGRPSDMAAARIDALDRLGKLAKQDWFSFTLLEKIVGEEFYPGVVAARIGMDERFIGMRFREALWRAASFYRLSVKIDSKPRPIRGVMSERPTLDRWMGEEGAQAGQGAAGEGEPVGDHRETQSAASGQTGEPQ